MNEGTATAPYAGASRGAIAHHYDVDTEFWRLWLDERVTYSCALWEDGDTLDRAQERKLDFMIDGAGAAGAARVLDIGCGWGSMLRRLRERGAEHVVGITLSEAQRDAIAAWDDPHVEVHATGWADYRSDEPFDAIISIGAFEHFARLGLTRDGKVDAYRAFFDRCHELLRPDGRLALQTIAKGDVALDGRGVRDFALIATQIFRESDLPHPADIVHAIEQRFEPELLRNDRPHYVRTCRAWLERLEANRDAAVAVAGEDVYDLYRRYLEACIRQFERGHAYLLRTFLRRVEPGTPFRLGGGA
jgi:cyclopropane-fatty-acyl-phospholipid synthase